MGHDNAAPPEYVFLVGREIGLDDDFLSVRDPTLRLLTVEHLPLGVELGVAFALLEPGWSDHTVHVHLEVVRPSGNPALSVSGTIDRTSYGGSGIWARTLRVLVDETGTWTVCARAGEVVATRVVDVVLEAVE
ncbi:hypothetical protein [Nocardiopsis sp. NPDC055824]